MIQDTDNENQWKYDWMAKILKHGAVAHRTATFDYLSTDDASHHQLSPYETKSPHTPQMAHAV